MNGMEMLEVQRPRAFAEMWKWISVGAVAAMGLLPLGGVAHARPEPIPPPTEDPEPEESPGTGQDAPVDPEDPEPIPPPEGLDCIAEDGGEEEDQSDCDPDHPGNPDGDHPGNTPSSAWYDDMAMRMYYLQEDLEQMSAWADSHSLYIYYYSMWMMSVVQQYYAVGFYPSGDPREYPYGYMTRGDFNYYLYYWVRPIYYSLLYYSAQYYNSHLGEPQIPEYQQLLSNVASSYHPLVACNYGFNGDDTGAREDTSAYEREADAGIGDD